MTSRVTFCYEKCYILHNAITKNVNYVTLTNKNKEMSDFY